MSGSLERYVHQGEISTLSTYTDRVVLGGGGGGGGGGGCKAVA